ncbi:EAL domain-containing protein [Paracoccus sp. (in: a-proteobacteria)]|uniref:EAL domain-containing protein n=1 Tax=Paracoccus sp. TaxID=267 RepID=UPI0032207633
MSYGMATALARLAGLARRDGGGRGGGRGRLAMVLRVLDGPGLRAGIGAAQFERLLDLLTLRLVQDLCLQPQPRAAAGADIRGLLPGPGLLPEVARLLQSLRDEGIDPGGLRVCPRLRVVLVRDPGGDREAGDLLAFGSAVMDRAEATQTLIHAVDMPPAAPCAAPGLSGDGELRFQPQICCDTGAVLALQLLPPGCGLDAVWPVGLAEGALRRGLGCLAAWDRMGRHVPMLSLGLAAPVLASPDIVPAILWELDRQELVPARLEIEIAAVPGAASRAVKANLQRLAAAGCHIALGQFGSAGAGLDELKGQAIGKVRIGREFVQDCHQRADQQRMILAVLALAQHLAMSTLASGVETAEEAAFLAQIGLHGLQGPAVAPPLSAAGVDDFLQTLGPGPARGLPARRRA